MQKQHLNPSDTDLPHQKKTMTKTRVYNQEEKIESESITKCMVQLG